jgi:very-short-patch-repair endonuclease
MREYSLQKHKILIVRFTNDEIEHHLEAVINELEEIIKEREKEIHFLTTTDDD